MSNSQTQQTQQTQHENSETPWGLTVFFCFLLICIILVYYSQPLRDGDIWFHLLFGQFFLENKTLIPDNTLYSWTPSNNSLIYCTWLGDIVLFLLYQIGKLKALFLFRYFCIFFFAAAALSHAKRLGLLHHPLTWFLCIISVLMANAAIICKPEIMTFVFMTVIVWNYWHIKINQQQWKKCYLFPLIMLFWVNTHGGVIFGYFFILLAGLGEILNIVFNRLPLIHKTRVHFFPAILLSFSTLFITPYGYRYPVDLLKNLLPTDSNMHYLSHITAHLSPLTPDPLRLDFYNLLSLALIVFLLVLLSVIRTYKIDFTFFFTLLGFTLLSTIFHRTTFYLAPVYFFSTLSLLEKRRGFLFSANLKRTRYITLLLLSCWLSVTVVHEAVCYPQPYMHVGFGTGDSEPVYETAFIRQYFPGQNIGNTYNQGSYLLWHLWQKNKVMIDSRHFPYRAWSNDFFNFTNAPEQYKNFLEQYQSDIWCVGFQRPQLCLWFAQNPDWTLVFYGNNSAVFKKKTGTVNKTPATTTLQRKQMAARLENGYAALAILRFALTIQDWESAKIILARMQTYSSCRHNARIAQSALGFTRAYQAYFIEDYSVTANLLENSNVCKFLENRSMLAFAYCHLANTAWIQGDLPLARTYSARALAARTTIHTLFNFGLIHGWSDEKRRAGIAAEKQHWYQALRKSIRLSSSLDPASGNTIRTTATSLMQGKILMQPGLLLPPAGLILSSGTIKMQNL